MERNYQRVVTPESKLEIACPRCGHVTKAFNENCPQCGVRLSRRVWKSGNALIVIGGIIAVAGLVGNILPDQPIDLKGTITCLILGVLVFAGGFLFR